MSKRRKTQTVKGKKLTSRQLQSEVLRLFKRHPKKRLNPKQISKKLNVLNNKDSIQYVLDKLVAEKFLIALEDYKYKIRPQMENGKSEFHVGRVDMTRKGSAYIIIEGQGQDVHVSAKYLNSALNGDQVKVRTWYPRGRRKPEGEIVKIVSRATEHFIGTIWEYPKYILVAPDNMPLDIIIPPEETKGAHDGEKVVVKITQWPTGKQHNPVGKVTTVLGKAGSSDIEMKGILINNGFQLEFPEEVIAESEALTERISEAEIAHRRDMRAITTFTIDPDTAKDFDDALSFRHLDNGHIEVGVHIADVSHFVLENTPLDKEALERSTSVYLVDRVLPMLPEKLSNELCSLRPHEDKLTFSAVFTFNKHHKVIDRWFGKTVIHSDRRFTYEEAQEVLEQKNNDFSKELLSLNRIAKDLRRDKFKHGAINFETDEVKFRLADDGTPLEVYIKERKEAHMLIEDFMLLANREVATFIYEKGKQQQEEIPFVYRIHDTPDPDKAAELARFAHELGFEMDISSPEQIARSYNRLVEKAQEDPGLKLLQPLAIRTMAKAAYSTDNIGHYGLGFDYYSHFTSPIRRYSDVLAHRILERNLGKETFRTNKIRLEEQCKHISNQERRAMEAERESVKYKQVEYIEKHVGEEFDGFISGFGDRGFFVELAGNRCEGMVGYDRMDEPFELADSRLYITGQYSGTRYKMGDPVRIKILEADLSRRRIELDWVVKPS